MRPDVRERRGRGGEELTLEDKVEVFLLGNGIHHPHNVGVIQLGEDLNFLGDVGNLSQQGE